MASRTSAVRLSVEGLQASIAALRQAGEEGQRELEKIGVGAENASRGMGRLEQATRSVSSYGRSNIFQQLGYQVGDFAVQVQGGTSVVTAFVQQGSQIAGAFGPAGAVIGALGAIVGGAYTYFSRMSEGIDDAATELKKLTEGTDSYGDALKAIQPLQESFLQGLVRGQTAAENQAKAVADAAAKVTGDLSGQMAGIPGLGYVQPGTMTTGEVGRYGPPTAAQRITELRSTYTEEEKLQQSLNADRLRDAKAIQDYMDNREEERVKKHGVNVGAGGFETSGGSFRSAEKGSLDELGKYDQAQVQKQVADAEQARQQKLRKDASDAAAAATRNATAARQAQALAERQQDIIDAEKLGVQSANELADAQDKSAAARERAQRVMESEARILQASHTLNEQQLADYRKMEAARLAAEDRGAAVKEKKKQTDDDITGYANSLKSRGNEDSRDDEARAAKVASDAERQAMLYADVQRDILIQPWRDLASQISQIMTGVFDGILSDAKGLDFGSIGTNFADSIRQSASSALSSVVTMPLTSTVSELARMQMQPNQTMGGMFKQFGSEHPYLAAGGLGYLGGQIVPQLLGMDTKYSGIGGGLGAALGMGLGGPLGAAAGGVLGSLGGSMLGGLFGGKDKPEGNSQQTYNSALGRVGYSDSKFDQQNRSITGGILGDVANLQKALEGLGGTIGDVTLNVQSGNNKGIRVNGKGFGSQEEADTYALRQLLASTTNLTGTQQIVARNTQGQNSQEIAQDLGFAKTFDDLTFSGREVDRQMQALNETFTQARTRASALGLDTGLLTQAWEKQAATIAENYETQRRQLSLQLQSTAPGGGTRQVDLALAANNLQFEELRKQAIALQLPLEQVTDAWQRSSAAIAENYEAQRRDLAFQIRSTGQSDTLQERLVQLNFQMQEMAKRATELQIPLEEVTAAHLRAGNAIIAENTRQRADLAFQIRSVGRPNTAAEQLTQLEHEMQELARSAAELQIPLSQVTAAHQRAAQEILLADQKMRRQFNSELANAITGSELDAQLTQLGNRFDELAERARELGYGSRTLADLEAARVREQADVIRQFQEQAVAMQTDIQNKVLGIKSFYDDLISPLQAVNNNAVLTPAGQIGAARQTFQDDLSRAQSGDVEATKRLAGSAQGLQGLVTQNYGTAGLGAEYSREIAAGTGGVVRTLQQEQAAAMADLPTAVERMRVDIVRENRADIDRVVGKLEELRRDLRSRGIAA